MGEIMDSHYDAAWRAAGAAADGKRQALKELEPRIQALESRIKQLEADGKRQALKELEPRIQALESRIKQLESEIHARQFRSSKA